MKRNNPFDNRRSNDESLGRVLMRLIEVYGLKDKLMEARIKDLWERVMGVSIARQTRKIYMQERTLHIHVVASALRHELNFAKSKIQQLLNDELDEPFIQAVEIRS